MALKARARKHPEFEKEQEELAHKLRWAGQMAEDGRLTKSELKEYEAHLASAYLDALPTELFVEMRDDGSLADLEAVARHHDGTRDGYDVRRDREALDRRVTENGLDEAWSRNVIDSGRYLEQSWKYVPDDDLRMRMTDATDEDRDNIATEILLGRNAPELLDQPAPSSEERIKSADED